MIENETDTPGLDLHRLTAWMTENVGELHGELTAELIVGGRSNLTYSVTDGQHAWVARRPPLGHVLASAHDMSREYRVMSALQETGVPVPQTVAFSDDLTVLGAPFYVMKFVGGTVYRKASELKVVGRSRTRIISTDLVDTLIKLHEVDPESVGLGDMGRVEGYLGRQVKRWGQQLDSSHNRDLPDADRLRTLLAERVPTESSAGIVHGDYSLNNTLVDEGTDTISAVLDWEMATVGDPITDLALMVLYHRLGERLQGETVSDVASADGFLTEDEVIARYTQGSSRDLSNFSFYLGLASFKLATILEGIHYRHLKGQTVGDGFDVIGDVVPPLLDMGLTYMKESH